MTTLTKTEKTYSISWEDRISWDFQQRQWSTTYRGNNIWISPTSNLKEALETFEAIAADDKDCKTLSLYEWEKIYFLDSDNNKWIFDKGTTTTVKRLKLLGKSQA